ncbi:MAG: hypothetical protein ISS80_05135 [Candidatus Cloacimonetes bacterium]|nr:hypothetical protein [Candidatus Cloacimonadota bacterium]MBL7149438.1 hypothetical protein [Candidatus Cloacimonadota bacterium]
MNEFTLIKPDQLTELTRTNKKDNKKPVSNTLLYLVPKALFGNESEGK